LVSTALSCLEGDEKMEKDLSKESVKHLLDHWIEHNESHSTSFRERATQIAKVSEKAAQDIRGAAELMDQCTEMLKKAMQDL
jgi:DNA repair ATPase RecN